MRRKSYVYPVISYNIGMASRASAGAAGFVNWFGPLLDALRELGGSARPREVVAQIAHSSQLPESALQETLKSGVSRFHNQVAWARQYLVWEGLIDDSRRGIWALSAKGQETALDLPQAQAIFRKWAGIHRHGRKGLPDQELLARQEEEAPEQLEPVIAPSLLDMLQRVTPKGFEHLCKRLLREHGFEDVVVTGGSHDGGIDGYGTLELNPFVRIKVLFQCKRYKGTVSRAQVGDFRNAMIGRAEKGIILTTGTFSEDARREAAREGAPPVELIDGARLVSLFEERHLGVRQRIVYEVDLAFFDPFLEDRTL